MKRQQNIKVGKAKGYLIKHIQESHIKVEWQTATIFIKTPGQSSKLLVQWSVSQGWRAQDGLLRANSNDEVSAEIFVREMDEP